MRILKKILIGSRNLLLFLFVSSLLAVVAYKFIPVYYTPLMFIRVYEQVRDSKSIKLEHKWMPLKQIAQPLAQAVVASEDNLFLDHDGFDMIQIQKARADAEKNCFGVKSRLSLQEWQRRGWIIEPDPRGWFQWYCRYYYGRRLPEIDNRQIRRWKAFNRHRAQIEYNCLYGDLACRPRQRQALLQWAYNPFI